MEQDKVSNASAQAASCACDREVFQRVWRRVMPEERPDSPIVVDAPEDGEESAGLAVVPAAQAPAVRVESVPGLLCGEVGPGLPECGSVPCLGEASAVYAPQLQQYIDFEVADCRAYQALSRRAQGNPARTLSAMAADERRHAKRLAAAYFLISGVRYWPAERGGSQPVQPFMAALREHFAQEQRAQCSYLAAAEETTDPCLRELYLELAGDEEAHAGLLRGILEQM